jgi:hypothetical protein
MRADCVPLGSAGRWTVKKGEFTPAQWETMKRLEKKGLCQAVPPGRYTWLFCLTMESALHPPGVVVMNDYPCELKKHLQFVLSARGRVLVTGLGLGCVVRGLLAAGRIESIDVIERSGDVLKLCAESVSDRRVTIHQQDALWPIRIREQWDYAWHDLWSDPERSEPHLQISHMELFGRLMDRVRFQGAWAMPRKFRRRVPGWLGVSGKGAPQK